MPTKHYVKQGEDVDSIALKYGFSPETIWENEANKELKKKRKNPNVLSEGDEVIIPDLNIVEEKIQTNTFHRFRRKGFISRLRLQIIEDDEPRSDVPYILKIKTMSGIEIQPITDHQTDQDGYIIELIPPDALTGEIILDTEGNAEYIPLKFGHIDPLDEGLSGVQSMLNNMGYYCGEEDAELGDRTIAAIREFQTEKMALEEDKLLPYNATEIDRDTLDAIVKEYSG